MSGILLPLDEYICWCGLEKLIFGFDEVLEHCDDVLDDDSGELWLPDTFGDTFKLILGICG